jgi:hypothetical protein
MAKQVAQCLLCVALAEKRVNSEPHSALKKTGDLDLSQGHEERYACEVCGTKWSRFIKNEPAGAKLHYWETQA